MRLGQDHFQFKHFLCRKRLKDGQENDFVVVLVNLVFLAQQLFCFVVFQDWLARLSPDTNANASLRINNETLANLYTALV